MTQDEKVEKIQKVLESRLMNSEIIDIHNSICLENDDSGDMIWNMDDFNEMLNDYEPIEIANMLDNDFDTCAPYFFFDGHIHSMWMYWDEGCPIDTNEIAWEIVRQLNDFGYQDIADILNKEETND